ncbi:MAG: TIGR02206 family membrane protein [Thiohalocapsa sp.]|uniref:YwaF family protein n=1 Tax=Thiohalocapsa sp. TaxID=2497641 RepID=UPI0025FA0049|nr:TIGR02206 family membrane protein [Thiohalocapsa sp.]MCG6939620.1 TIGR02206 family membrane protein [Thiohalocapsa sp.]
MQAGPRFLLFGDAHLWTLGLIVAVAVLLPLAVRRLWPLAVRPVAVLLALLLLVQEVGNLAMQVLRWGVSVELLPLHLCSLAVFVTAWALLSGNSRVYEVAYFWAFGGTTQALLTPDLRFGFPDPAYVVFFASHGLVVVGVLYATLALGLRPRPMSIVRVALVTFAVAVVVFFVDLWLGTNFMYLMAKPEGASLLDWFGPWPWYWLGLIGVALASFLVLYAPFLVLDLRRRKPIAAASAGESG